MGVVHWFLGFTLRSRVECVQRPQRRLCARSRRQQHRPIQADDLQIAPAGGLFVNVAAVHAKFIFGFTDESKVGRNLKIMLVII